MEWFEEFEGARRITGDGEEIGEVEAEFEARSLLSLSAAVTRR